MNYTKRSRFFHAIRNAWALLSLFAAFYYLFIHGFKPRNFVESASAIPIPQPLSPQRLRRNPVPETKKETLRSCCWCREKYTQDNVVEPYSSRAFCEDNPLSSLEGCKRIEIKGNACSFVNVSGRAGNFHCSVHSLVYREEGIEKNLPAPAQVITPCDSDLAGSFGSMGRTAVSTPRGSDSFWSCTAVPNNPRKCKAEGVRAGAVALTQEKDLDPQHGGCSSDVCWELFSSTFASQFSAYVP